jgi:hypothetical protein
MIMMFGGTGVAAQERSPEWIAGMHELMTKLDTELKESGECLASEALADPSQAKTVRFAGGAPAARISYLSAARMTGSLPEQRYLTLRAARLR